MFGFLRFRASWGPADNYPPPRPGQNRSQYRGKVSKSPNSKGKSGGGTPPKKGCGGKKKMFATFAILVISSAAQISAVAQIIG